jgi:hypothetical protein
VRSNIKYLYTEALKEGALKAPVPELKPLGQKNEGEANLAPSLQERFERLKK